MTYVDNLGRASPWCHFPNRHTFYIGIQDSRNLSAILAPKLTR